MIKTGHVNEYVVYAFRLGKGEREETGYVYSTEIKPGFSSSLVSLSKENVYLKG